MVQLDYYVVDPRQARKTLRCENWLINFGYIAVALVVVTIVFAALSLPVIRQYHNFQAYNETTCCCTRNIERWCRAGGDSCEATAEVTSAAGQTVKLKFPSYQLFRGGLREYNRWVQHINNTTFQCHVQDSEKITAGVIDYKIDKYGWYFIASLAAVCLASVLVYLLIFIVQQKVQRKPASALPIV